jgi:hypothetical protein
MRFTQSDIVEDMLAHIRELGGDFSEWCVGTASTIQDGRFKIQDATESGMATLIYRAAYTPYAAADVAERLADCGLRPERASVPAPGYIVFVYRPNAATPATPAPAVSARPALLI